MANFPRAARALSFLASPWRYPSGLQSWGIPGKGQGRSVINMGRSWTETYNSLNTQEQSVRALLAVINQTIREPGTLWQIQHPYLMVNHGAGGGTPNVLNGGQTGGALTVRGAPPSTVDWLRAGDIMQVAGCAVLFDIMADVTVDGSGDATIQISPPIFAGGSPIDTAAVNIVAPSIYLNCLLEGVEDFPQMDSSLILPAGLTLRWREQPAL